MSWYKGSYGNVEGVGHDINQNGARYIPGFNVSASASSASGLGSTAVSVVGYALGTVGTAGVSPPAANAEIYGVIPKGGAQPYNNQTVYYSNNTTDTLYRQLFRVEPGKPGERFEVPYATHTDSSPSIGGRVVCAGGGSVKRSPQVSVVSDSTDTDEVFAESELRVNWVCVDTDTTNKYCIIERL